MIGGTPTACETFSDAINLLNVNPGSTLKLNENVGVNQTFVISSDATINLNGKGLSHTGNKVALQVVSDATLTIDGTKSGSTFGGRINVGKGTNNNGNLVLNGGTYSCGAGQTVLHLNGTCQNSSVTINNATITSSDDNGIQLSANGTYTITNSQITGKTGIYLKSGNLTLTNSTISSNATEHTAYNFNNNGSNATGDAIVVDSCGYPGGVPTLTIGDGNIFNVVADSGNAQIGYYEKEPEVELGNVIANSNSYIVNEGYVWTAGETAGTFKLVKATV